METFYNENKMLRPQMEGKLYVSFWGRSIASTGTFFIDCNFYTVKNGNIHEIRNGKIAGATGDELFIIFRDCKCLGNYDPSMNLTHMTKDFAWEDMKEMFNINYPE